MIIQPGISWIDINPATVTKLMDRGSIQTVGIVTDVEPFLRALVIELEKDTPLAGQAYLALAQLHRKQGKTDQAARDMQDYRRIQAVAGHPPS